MFGKCKYESDSRPSPFVKAHPPPIYTAEITVVRTTGPIHPDARRQGRTPAAEAARRPANADLLTRIVPAGRPDYLRVTLLSRIMRKPGSPPDHITRIVRNNCKEEGGGNELRPPVSSSRGGLTNNFCCDNQSHCGKSSSERFVHTGLDGETPASEAGDNTESCTDTR